LKNKSIEFAAFKKLGTKILLVLFINSLLLSNFAVRGQGTEVRVVNPVSGDNNFIFSSANPVGFRFNLTVWVYNVQNLFAYQVNLKINDTILNITRAWTPTWDPSWVFYGKPNMPVGPAYYDNDNDGVIERVLVGSTLLGAESFTGTGLLAIIELKIIYAPPTGTITDTLNINNQDTILLNPQVQPIPTTKTDGNYQYVVRGITIKAEPEKAVLGQHVNITGRIVAETPMIGVNVTIQYRLIGQEWQNLTKVQTDSNSQYNYTWITNLPGVFQLRSLYEIDGELMESAIITVTVKYNSILTIQPSTTNTTAYSKIWFIGTVSRITFNGSIQTPPEPANITIQWRLKGTLDFTNLANITVYGGTYQYEWTAKKMTFDSNETLEFRVLLHEDAITYFNTSDPVEIKIWKIELSITISVEPQTVQTGSKVTISGGVNPPIENLTIKIGKYSILPITGYDASVGTNKTDSSGSFKYTWNIPRGICGQFWLAAWYSSHESQDKNIKTTDLSKLTPVFINITKLSSSITISVNQQTVQIGSPITINGVITPAPMPGTSVAVKFRVDGGSWGNLIYGDPSLPTTDDQGRFNITWKAGKIGEDKWKGGIYELYAEWLGDANTYGAKSTIITLIVQRLSSNITLEVTPSSITLGSSVTITGYLKPDEANPANITIYYKNATGNWILLTTVSTNASGFFTYTWTPQSAGNFEIYANWAGNDIYDSAQSDIKQIKVEEPFSIFTYLPYIIAIIAVIVIVIVSLIYIRKKKRTK